MNWLADQLNQWRVVPRALMAVYMYLLIEASYWFMALPDPNGPQSAFISAVWAVGAAWFGIYVNGKPT